MQAALWPGMGACVQCGQGARCMGTCAVYRDCRCHTGLPGSNCIRSSTPSPSAPPPPPPTTHTLTLPLPHCPPQAQQHPQFHSFFLFSSTSRPHAHSQ
eukprot:35069-Chlamydomonas_euryale.AAC.3